MVSSANASDTSSTSRTRSPKTMSNHLDCVSLSSAWRVLAMLSPSSSSLVFQDYFQTPSLVVLMKVVVLFGASMYFWKRDTVGAVLYPCFLVYRQHVLGIAGLACLTRAVQGETYRNKKLLDIRKAYQMLNEREFPVHKLSEAEVRTPLAVTCL